MITNVKKTFSLRTVLLVSLFVLRLSSYGGEIISQDSVLKDSTTDSLLVYNFDIAQNIEPSAWRLTKRAFGEARRLNADYIVANINTYGGLVNIADSIRTAFLNSNIPVIAYITNNAASAGALISIAADSIYMKE